jgi:hypothetical protein
MLARCRGGRALDDLFARIVLKISPRRAPSWTAPS